MTINPIYLSQIYVFEKSISPHLEFNFFVVCLFSEKMFAMNHFLSYTGMKFILNTEVASFFGENLDSG